MTLSFPIFCLVALTVYAGLSSQSAVTVTRGSHVILNCSLDTSTFKQYSLFWNVSNKKGHRNETLHFQEDAQRQPFVPNLSLVIEKTKIWDNGEYNCSVTRTLPPPTKSYFGPLIQLCVHAPPKMLVDSALTGEHEATVVCALLEFYPEDIRVELNTTCGEVLHPVKGSTLVRNVDGSVNATYEFQMKLTNCSSNPLVTCVANHVTGVVKHTLSLKKPIPTSTSTDAANLQLMLYPTGGILLSLLLVFLFYKAGMKYCLRKRQCSTPRQERTSNAGASTESVALQRRENDSSDVIYTVPTFAKAKPKKNSVNECATEYVTLRRL